MKRLMYPVAGTKERARGRQCLTFALAHGGPVLIDRVHPDDREYMFDRLWAEHGRGNVWASYRRLERHEQYLELDNPAAVA